MHPPNALRAASASTLALLPALLASGCAAAGFGRPTYVDLPALQERPAGEDQERVRDLLRGRALGLDQLFQAAELGNARIAAARHAVDAAAGRAWQAELYPNPTLGLQTEEVPAGSPGFERSENTVSLAQTIIVGGRRSAAIAAARTEGDARALALEQTRWDVAAAIREVRTDLLYLQGAEELTTELIAAAQQTHEVAATRLRARATPESEVLKAQVELERLELAHRRLRRERRAALVRLAALVGVDDAGDLRLAGQLPRDLPDLDLGFVLPRLTEQPGLLAARAEGEAAAREVELAHAQRIPDLGLTLSFGRNNTSDQQILEGGISIPLPLFDRNQGRIHEAEATAAQRRRDAEAMQRRLHAELADLLAEYDSARDAARTHSERIVPAAERAFTQVSEGYRAGRAGFLDLLDAQRTLAEVRLSQLDALRDAHRAMARLTRLTGPLTTE